VAILELQTRSFRNLEDGAVHTGAASVFLVGENGQGKSNFLDAVYTLCYANSFRGASDSEAARLESASWLVQAVVGALANKDYADGKPSVGFESEFSVRWENGTKSLKENGKTIQDRKRLVEANPAIVFCHGDMEFARGEPERRRFFFDQTAGLVSPLYIDTLRLYRRVLKARNAALKERMLDVLPMLDLQLATYGLSLMDARSAVVSAFDPVFSGCYETVSRLGFQVRPVYKPSWRDVRTDEEIVAKLEAARDRELAVGTTLSGPHRDRYAFADEHGDFSARASTGQLRLMALTLRIAQAMHFSNASGRKPILLLDDVLLELDPEKRRRFMEALPANEQAFFTFLPGEPYRDYAGDSSLIYWTEHGRFVHTAG